MRKQNRVAFFNILSIFLLRGISLITAPLFTHLLGDSGYGMAEIYKTWVTVVAIVFTMQTYGTLANAQVEYPETLRKHYYSSAMSLSVLLYLVFSALVLLFMEPISRYMKLPPLMIGLILVQAFGTFCVNFLNTKNVYEFKAGFNMALAIGVNLTTLALSLLFVLGLPKEINYYGRVGATAATYAVIGIPTCIYILTKGKTFYHKEYWKFCAALAIPAVFYSLSDVILSQIDKVMLQQMLGAAQLGQYSAALSLSGIVFTIYQALDNSWRPFYFEDMKLGSREQVHKKAVHYLELLTVLAVGFILLAPEVYKHFFVPEEFWGSAILIPIFVSSYYLNFLCTFPVNFEQYHKKTKVIAVVTVFTAVLNAGLNYVMIKKMGMTGAAVATMVSHCVQLAMHYVYTRYILGKSDYPFTIRLWGKYAACYVLILALVYLTENLWLLRWGLGTAIGIWELLRIKKRKVLI